MIGAHCASLTLYNYPEFGEMLGGYFNRNLPQGTIAILKVEDTKHPATKMLGAGWPLVDEFYLFGTAPWDASKPGPSSRMAHATELLSAWNRIEIFVALAWVAMFVRVSWMARYNTLAVGPESGTLTEDSTTMRVPKILWK